MNSKRILIICGAAKSLVTFRGDLIRRLIAEGHEVVCAAPFPEDNTEFRDELERMGADTFAYPLNRAGISPISDLKTLFFLKKKIEEYKIDLVFPYTIKSVIYGSLAAEQTNTPVISLITGLGFTFSGVSTKANILQKVTSFLYKKALRKNNAIIFQNEDDKNLFLRKKIISPKQNAYLVNGSGVNLNEYNTRIKKNDGEQIVFVIVSRLIVEKGIKLFMDAAKKLKKKYPKSEYHIIGPIDTSPSGIKKSTIDKFVSKGIIKFHGEQRTVVGFLEQSDIFVLPTYYREGVPRSILEALSIGMPIITTDTPGCRETVIDEKNGVLIAPRDFDDLYRAMESFLKHPERIETMGINSRKLASEKFDVEKVNAKTLEIIASNS